MRLLLFGAIIIWLFPTMQMRAQVKPDNPKQTIADADLKAANDVIRAYTVAVADEIIDKLDELGGQEAVLKKFQSLGEKHLLENKEVLHRKAESEFLKFDQWVTGENEKLVPIKKHAKQLADMVEIFSGGYGVPPYGFRTLATKWWHPEYAAKKLRELSLKGSLSEHELGRLNFVEQFNAPQIFRQNDDIEKPILAFFDGKELFVVQLKYSDVGIFALKKIDWFSVVKK